VPFKELKNQFLIFLFRLTLHNNFAFCREAQGKLLDQNVLPINLLTTS